MFNVLHLVLGLQVGGLEHFLLDLLRHMDGQINSHIACMNYGGELVSQAGGNPVFPLYRYVGTSTPKKVWHLRRYCVEQRIDLIHTHNVGPHLVGSLTGLSLQIPVIHTKHGRNDPDSKKEILFSKIASLATSSVVAVSQDAADLCKERNLSSADKVKVIVNGVDSARFHPPREKRCSAGPIVIGIVARIAKEKNHVNLLRAIKMLIERKLNLELMVVGDGPLMGEVTTTTKELGIDGVVQLLGARENIPDLLHKMDIFVLPSLSEGIPLTILEAMACELPVVATDVGGNAEVVQHHVTGLLVPSDDSQALADALTTLIVDPDLRKRMGQAGRKRVKASFSIENTVQQYLNLYQQALKA